MKSVIGVGLFVVLATSTSLAAFVNPSTVCALNCAYDLGDQGCYGMTDKLYQTCENCFRFIRCQGGKETERGECTDGWWFSTVNETCQPPTVTACCGCYCTDIARKTTTATTTTTTSTSTTTTMPTPTTATLPRRPCVGTGISTGYGCITNSPSSCRGLPDGDYQACEGCTYYHSCVAGYLNYAFRPCPRTNQGGLRGYLVWQRAANKFNVGTCEYSSNTCTECFSVNPNPPPTVTPAVPTTKAGTCTSTGNACITSSAQSCRGLPDGDYQACEGCTFYHSCVAGYLNYAFRPCPLTNQGGLRGYLIWQRAANKFNVGTCEYSSNTCTECLGGNPDPPPTVTPVPTIKAGTCTNTGNGCITSSSASCRGLPDGDYQACEGCTFYHSCVAGYLNYAFRPCPLTNQGGLRGYLVWQRAVNKLNVGTCEYSSNTCTECLGGNPNPPPTVTPVPTTKAGTCTNTGNGCITSSARSCRGLPDGDYQACEGCTFYHSCVAGYLNYAFRPCPLTNQGGLRGYLVWQRAVNKLNVGTCEYSSNTCTECLGVNPNPPPTVTPVPTTKAGTCTNTGNGCITSSARSCRGLPDGDYQACEGCTFYHSCVAGYLNYAFRPCPLTNQGGLRGYLVWQRAVNKLNVGTCEYSSNTCTECLGGTTTTTAAATTTATTTPTLPSRPCVGTGISTGYGCITSSPSSCNGLSDGDYQACEGCTYYHSCVAGYLNYAFRPCPKTNYGGLRGYLVWQRKAANVFNQGTCEYTSNTCTECTSGATQKPPVTPTPTPPPTVSPTKEEEPIWTPCQSTGSSCLAAFPGACSGRADGHYQACEGCTIYHSCSGRVLYPSRLCAKTFSGGLRGRLVWRQVTPTAGICDYTSNTCTECVTVPSPTVPPTCPASPRCVHSSADCRRDSLVDGDYQVCQSCFHYLSCRSGETWPCRPCPSYNDRPYQWKVTSHAQGYCAESSDTCNQCPISSGKRRFLEEVKRLELGVQRKSTGSSCITGLENSCERLGDGDYQACESCSVYHSCVEGTIIANRDCPPDLVWQTTGVGEGRCEYTSTSCRTRRLRKTFDDVFF